MKIFLTALAACALVACSGEPAEQSDATGTDTNNVETPADSGAAKAQVVSLQIAGMT
jgi:hypothetical protein